MASSPNSVDDQFDVAADTPAVPVRSPSDDGRGSGVPTIKAFGVLEAAVGHDRPLSVTELGLMVGVPKPTMHRIVRMLEGEGLLQREPGQRRYQPGPRLLEFAVRVLGASLRTAPRHAVLERLSADLGETCNLGIMIDSHAVYIDRVEAAWPLGLRFEAGSRVPMHCTAIGKLLLAHLPRSRRDHMLEALPLARYTDNTMTDPLALSAALDAIREQGYSVDDQEFLAGVVCLAVPVRDNGAVVAGLAVSAPAVRMPVARAIGYIERMNAAALNLAETFRQVGDGGAI